MINYSWKVLLIGGSSGVGKTMIAAELARQLSLSVLLLDDIRIAIQQATTAKTNPDIQVFLNYSPEEWHQPETILADWIRVAQAMHKPVDAIVSHHLVVPASGRIIIERDGILSTPNSSKEVCKVFIVEQNQEQLLHNLQSRGRGFNTGDTLGQECFARASWMYGQWLAKEAEKYGLSVIDTCPRQTLWERSLATIGT